jgi:uncharacterized membrane protein YkvA (DUF1232 family)
MPQTQMVRYEKPSREGKLQMKSRMKNLLMFLPNMVRLCGKLLVDNRVPLTEKALFAAAIVYAISPLDFIPDIIPFVGQMDDIYLIAMTLLRLVNRTDENVVRQHWAGGGDIVALANSIASLAPALLPKRVSKVLSSRVELADAGKIISSINKKKTPLMREIPPIELVDQKKDF